MVRLTRTAQPQCLKPSASVPHPSCDSIVLVCCSICWTEPDREPCCAKRVIFRQTLAADNSSVPLWQTPAVQGAIHLWWPAHMPPLFMPTMSSSQHTTSDQSESHVVVHRHLSASVTRTTTLRAAWTYGASTWLVISDGAA